MFTVTNFNIFSIMSFIRTRTTGRVENVWHALCTEDTGADKYHRQKPHKFSSSRILEY